MFSRDSLGRAQFGWVEYIIQLLIVLSLISIAIETEPDLSTEARDWLDLFELISIALFTVEYVARLMLSRPARAYGCSFLGVVDLAAVLPFYLGVGFDFRSVRAFRLLRLFRILKLTRYSLAMQRFRLAFIIVKEELVLFGAITGILLYLPALGIYYFEHEAQPGNFRSLFDSLWWAVSTLTTVGYGDIYPITVGGRCFTFVVLVIGLGVVAVPTGLIASALAKARQAEDAES